jgi:hypothetical protein
LIFASSAFAREAHKEIRGKKSRGFGKPLHFFSFLEQPTANYPA